MANAALRKNKKVYSLGPIIHNPQVVDRFSKKGLKVIKSVRKEVLKGASLVIPSHGVNPSILKAKCSRFIDTTCPFVRRVQEIIKRLKKEGYFIIIVGDKKHPEVKALASIAGKNCCILKNKKEAKRLKFKAKKLALISQTTASLLSFKEILSEAAKGDFKELVGYNTVCKNTIDRQAKAALLAGKVDAMIVIGGKNSANTSRLAEICKCINVNTHHIEHEGNLNTSLLRNKKTIGVAAGASTPPYAINEVIEKIRRIDQ